VQQRVLSASFVSNEIAGHTVDTSS